jgi:putative transposase
VSMVIDYGISVVQASKAMGVARSTIAYKPKPKDDSVWIELLGAFVERHPGIGFDKAYHRIRHQGHLVNKKKLYRIYTDLGLNIRRRKRKRLPARVKQALFMPEGPVVLQKVCLEGSRSAGPV